VAETVLVELFKHNRWANDQLLEFCGSLKDEQLDKSSPGTYGSIKDTLVHLVAAQSRYVLALSGNPSETEVHESKGYPGVDTLRKSSRETSERLVDLATKHQQDSTIEARYRNENVTLQVSTLLLQAINHATEHRAHVCTILGQQGVEPPVIDGWAYDKAR
jgi:uncharacterized damage-inducible protein DinB